MISINQKIYYYLEITKKTKVPFLLVSNPGYGKTTSIENYARDNGYHLQTLIGSQFSPEDILGFQVNEPNRETLIQKDPKWFSDIIAAKANGTPSILFIDEISTCSDSVQGSLLSLIFSRKIGNGKKLPDDCIVISAANYYGNLSSYFNILTPTLNRFCIVNLTEGYSTVELARQFLNPLDKAITPKFGESINIDTEFFDLIKSILVDYSNSKDSKGYIDFGNTELSDIYKKEGPIYNIMTGRTMYYLKEIVTALTAIKPFNSNIVQEIVGGLIGWGSGSFKDITQAKNFVDKVTSEILNLIQNNAKTKISVELETEDVAKEITNYLNSNESYNEAAGREESIYNLINNKYGNYHDLINKSFSKEEGSKFIDDYDNIKLFFKKANSYKKEIANILQTNSYIYNQLLGIKGEDFSKTDYGMETPPVIKKVMIGTYDGKITRLGEFGNVYVVIPDDNLVKNASLQTVISKVDWTPYEIKSIF